MKLVVPLVLALAPSAAWAQCPTGKWLPSGSDNYHYDTFGADVAISGDTALVAARGDDEVAYSGGAVYVFDVSSGALRYKLHPADPVDSKAFGYSIAVDGDVALIGAYWDNEAASSAGAVYVFDLATGAQLDKWLASDAAQQDHFGASVALEGNTALVGAPGDTSVYVIDVSTGQELRKLEPLVAETNGGYAIRVELDGGLAVVAASNADKNGKAAGLVYVYDVSTGAELLTLEPQNAGPFDAFGTYLDVDGGRALVGSAGPAIHWFDLTTGVELLEMEFYEEHTTIPSVALERDQALVGLVFNDGFSDGTGRATLVDLTSGTEVMQFTAFDGLAGDRFGAGVALDAGRILIGASGRREFFDTSAGAAYRFDLCGPVGINYCGPAVPNSSGAPAEIEALGSDVVADGYLFLRASQLPYEQFGYFLVSATQGLVANPGGSQGNLCLGGTIGRYKELVRGSGAFGEFAIQVDLDVLPPPIHGAVQAGQTWNFTSWFRDANPTSTSNFTDAVSVQFL